MAGHNHVFISSRDNVFDTWWCWRCTHQLGYVFTSFRFLHDRASYDWIYRYVGFFDFRFFKFRSLHACRQTSKERSFIAELITTANLSSIRCKKQTTKKRLIMKDPVNPCDSKNEWRECWERAKRVHSRKRRPIFVEKKKRIQEQQKKRKRQRMILRRMTDYTRPMCHLFRNASFGSDPRIATLQHKEIHEYQEAEYQEAVRRCYEVEREIDKKVQDLFKQPIPLFTTQI